MLMHLVSAGSDSILRFDSILKLVVLPVGVLVPVAVRDAVIMSVIICHELLRCSLVLMGIDL